MLRALRNYFRRPLDEQVAIAEAVACLAVARVALAAASFPRLARFLGDEGRETPVDEAAVPPCRLVSRAVAVASRRAPWETRCFAQALAATAMLRRRGLPSTAYFGVARDEERQFQAHAWVRCGTLVVTGGPGQERYAVVATFASGVGEPPTRRAPS